MKNFCWQAFFQWLRRDDVETTIKSIKDNWLYQHAISLTKKARLNVFKKNKNYTKIYFNFRQKKETRYYCGLLCTPLLLHKLSCVRFPDIKSSNPQIRASLLQGYIFCLVFCLFFAICKICARSSLWRCWSENTDKQ